MQVVKFVPVDPADLESLRGRGRKGGVSYPILKGFLDSEQYLVKLELDEGQTPSKVGPTLGQYIKSHDLPIKLFRRSGDIYLLRLDIDEEGNSIEDWNSEPESPTLNISDL
jgi:hypothetical protein